MVAEIQKQACDLAQQGYDLIVSAGGGQAEKDVQQQVCQQTCGGPCSGAEQERPIICYIIWFICFDYYGFYWNIVDFLGDELFESTVMKASIKGS